MGKLLRIYILYNLISKNKIYVAYQFYQNKKETETFITRLTRLSYFFFQNILKSKCVTLITISNYMH